MHESQFSTGHAFVGKQVGAPWQDGIFYPGVIRSVATSNTGASMYTVEFEDRYIKDYTDRQIIGPGFQNIRDIHLKFNQKVYITHGGLEVCGFVQKHRKQTNEVFIKLDDREETLVRKKLEEVRLLSSHKKVEYPSANSSGWSTSSSQMESKKRTVTDGVDVPNAKTLKIAKEEEPAMNEVMAAMILTSLQAASPSFQQCQPMDCAGPSSPGVASHSSDLGSFYGNVSPSPSTSSGHFSWDFNSRGTPSPGLSLSDVENSSSGQQQTAFSYLPHGTPVESMPGALLFSSSLDEGIDMGEGPSSVFWDDAKSPKKLKALSKTLYKCTWQKCTKTLCTVQGIERHIRTVHLGKKENDFSDHEEEFYYTEVESTMEAFSDTFSNMMASSPPPYHQDSNANVVSSSGHQFPPSQVTLSQGVFQSNQNTQHIECNPVYPISHSSVHTSPCKTIPNYKQPLSNTKHFNTTDAQRIQVTHQSRPQLTSPSKAQLQIAGLTCNTKIHAEGRKCRKVYGMENKSLWCTQCKWKKACVRFV